MKNTLSFLSTDCRTFVRQKYSSFFLGLSMILLSTGAPSLYAVESPSPAQEAPEPHETSQIIEKSPLIFSVGEQHLMRIPGLTRFSLGSPIVRARPLPKALNQNQDALLLRATAPGLSDLWVWKSNAPTEHRKIRVEKKDSEELRPALEKALSRLEEVEVLSAGSTLTLRGEILSLSEAARVQNLVDAFPKEIHDETVLSPELLEKGQNHLQTWLKQSPYREKVQIECRNGSLVALGSLENKNELTSLNKKLRSIFPAIQLELTTLPDNDPTVHFKVFLLELRKNRFRNLGLTWPGSSPSAFRVMTSGIDNLLSLDLALEALETDGSAKILSNPELVVRAPGEAELFSGGELPIHEQSRFFSNMTWKNFGLTLKLKVTQIAGERIRLEIFTEVSHLDPSLATDKVPGIQSNRMKTQVDARFGHPILLSGLLQQNMHQQARGLPGLRNLPILGALFGSEEYQNERSELVAILLPNATPPDPTSGKYQRLLDWQPQPEALDLSESFK